MQYSRSAPGFPMVFFNGNFTSVSDLKKEPAEFEVMKKYYTEKFLAECRVDESGKPIGDVLHLYTTFNTPEDRNH